MSAAPVGPTGRHGVLWERRADRDVCLFWEKMLQNSLLLDELDHKFVKYLVETRRPLLYLLEGKVIWL